MANYLKSPSKSSLLSMLKNADAITPKFMRSLLDGVAFKSDLVASEALAHNQPAIDLVVPHMLSVTDQPNLPPTGMPGHARSGQQTSLLMMVGSTPIQSANLLALLV
jgi:hypothetical protein